MPYIWIKFIWENSRNTPLSLTNILLEAAICGILAIALVLIYFVSSRKESKRR